jgi:hypothetical protein
MLAVRALREIRSAGGKMAGFKRSIVAALTWPALLVVFMAVYGLREIVNDSGVSIVWRILLCLVLLGASGLGVVMMRQVFRWMQNPRSEETPSRHVWRFATIAFVAVLCVGAFIPHKASSLAAYRQPSGTKGTWKLTVGAGKMTTFRVVRVNAHGNETPLEIGGTILAPFDRDFHTTLEIVCTDRWKENSRQQLTASYPAFSGQTYSRTAFLDDKWRFVTSGNDSLPQLEGQKERFELATRHDWFGRRLETLYVETVAATQPNATQPNHQSDAAAQPAKLAGEKGEGKESSSKELPRKSAAPPAVEKQP